VLKLGIYNSGDMQAPVQTLSISMYVMCPTSLTITIGISILTSSNFISTIYFAPHSGFAMLSLDMRFDAVAAAVSSFFTVLTE